MGLNEIRKLKQDALLPKEKKKYYIPKKSKKTIEKEKQQRDANGDSALDLWFEERRKEMKGRCVLCHGATSKTNNEFYRHSIHHLLEKSKFKSVATHESNWLEVCFWGNSCHQNIHNGKITWSLLMDSHEWKIIEAKLKNIIPYIYPDEIKHLPETLRYLLNEQK